MEKNKKKILNLIMEDIRRKFEKIYYINIQNLSINGSALYNGKNVSLKYLMKNYL